jgi:tRNA1(Val) A37 N6-methylase TrmN6
MELAKQLRPITKEEALNSYKSLLSLDCKIHPKGKRDGLKALDYFFLPHRLRAQTKHHLSFYNAMHDPTRVEFLDSLVRRWQKTYKTDKQRMVARYEAFQLYYGTINQFRPALAKWLYCYLGARVGILDFSAGWGGRAIAAMSLGIPYVGVDANTKLEPSYRRMIATYNPDAKISLFFQPSESVDFSKFNYDTIFTSPPYFMLEKYETMPVYKDKADFLDRFFRPVVMGAWKYLRKGGKMALNMPMEMYEAIREDLPPLHEKIVMSLPSRHPAAAAKGVDVAANKSPRGEFIFVWHKAGKRGQTRRIKRVTLNSKTRRAKNYV